MFTVVALASLHTPIVVVLTVTLVIQVNMPRSPTNYL